MLRFLLRINLNYILFLFQINFDNYFIIYFLILFLNSFIFNFYLDGIALIKMVSGREGNRIKRNVKLMVTEENRDGERDASRKRGQEPLTNYAMSQPATQTGSGLPLCDTAAN